MKNRTFFSQLAVDHPHFILAGHTDDRCCNDALQLTSMEYELHRHLKEENYDAIIFYNRQQRVYCYDYKSYRLFRDIHSADTVSKNSADTPESDDEINLTADGPLGLEWDLYDDEPDPTPAPTNSSRTLSNKAIGINAFWQNMDALFRSNKKIALILSNMNTMSNATGEEHISGDFSINALNTLINLGEYSGHNKSIAIYIFRGLDIASIEHQLRGQGDDWERFVSACLSPLLCKNNRSSSKMSQHVIRVDYPNAAEIRNLLMYMHMQDNSSLNIRESHIEAVALKLSYRCSSDNLTLNDLITRIESYIKNHPDHQISTQNCHELILASDCNTALEELNTLIGLDDVKKKLKSIYALAKQEGAKALSMPRYSSRFTPRFAPIKFGYGLNICLMGEPGTGKTEIANLLGRIYYEAGMLPTAHVETVKPSDILESQIGASGRAMADRVQRAIGGVLFIDEAYGLSEEKSGAAGLEAITQLVGDMTQYEGQFAVVLAGYEKEILSLLDANDGLKSRFLHSNYFHLAPYSWQEIRDILIMMAKKKNATFVQKKWSDKELEEVRALFPVQNVAIMNLSSDCGLIWLDNFCENWVGDRGYNWGNAREAKNLLEEMQQLYPLRMEREKKNSAGKYEFTPLDIPADRRVHLKPRSKGLDEAIANMNNLIGLNFAKQYLRNLCATLRWDQKTTSPGNFLFMGPPGTGKTFFAEHMAEILNHLHVLRRRTPTIINASDLIHRLYPHGTVTGRQETLDQIVERARGGMLFIDEAHQLKDAECGQRILRELVPLIENPAIRADTCFVLAGYQNELLELLTKDAGLESRFPKKNHIKFVNYTPEELTKILEMFAREKGYEPQPGYLTRTQNILNRYLDGVDLNFGNARFMRGEYLEESIRRRTKRLNKTNLTGIDENQREYSIPNERVVKTTKNINYLEETDVPESMDQFAAIGMPLLPRRDSTARLNELVGKDQVKEYVEGLKKSIGVPEFFDANATNNMHFVITGPTGSGRHTVARTLACLLYDMGILYNDRPLFRSKGHFEAGYVGQTIEKTQKVIDSAIGNMLVVEYPSSMIPKNSADNTFGAEALSTIVGAMEASSNSSIVFIDTPEGMDSVIKSVTGLRDKAFFFELEALSPMEMHDIFLKETANSFYFDDEISELLPSFFLNWVSDRGGLGEKSSAWANGSEINTLIQQLKMNWSRLNGEKEMVDKIPLRKITREMFPQEMEHYLVSTKVNHETALNELFEMTGLPEVKKAIQKIQRRLKRADKSCVIPGCYCFIGNPGTGKTTVARQMGGILKAVGVLEQGHVIERNAMGLMRNPDQFDEALKLAKNGILFIDEAHQFLTGDGVSSVVGKLITVLEDPNILRNTSIILAGYPQHMKALLKSDPGLERRFGAETNKIYFSDYSPEELLQIMKDLSAKAKNNPRIASPSNITLSEEFCEQSLRIFRAKCSENNPNFGNAGFVRNYINDAIDCLLARLADEEYIEYHLTGDDIPEQYRSIIDCQTCLPSTIVKDTISTAPITELITDRMMRRYTPTVTVYLVVYENGQPCGSGTGTIISKEGHILTCAHVVNGAKSVRARVYCPGSIGSEYRWFDCTILHPINVNIDMALLKMDGDNFPAASLRPADEPIDESEHIMLSGFPLGSQLSNHNDENLKISHFFGGISSVQDRETETIFADITGLQGNSGSPVFSMDDGRVIGVFTGSVTSKGKQLTEENNYFHPIRLFWDNFTIDFEM